MKKFFKVLSIFGLLAASVIFAFVIYGIKSIPDSIHLVSDEKLKFNEIYSYRISSGDVSVSVNSENAAKGTLLSEYTVDISALKPGEKMTVEWRGKPVWIIKRTPEQLAELPKLDGQLADPLSKRNPAEFTPAYAQNEHRSIKPEILVAVGICPHLGCSPSDKFVAGPQPSLPADWKGGFLCPCHGSTFDMAGRVFKNKPAPDNLPVPPHMYLSDTKLLIGEDTKAA